jgi:1-deoxy-D-xylulose-5-phosphate reductoisomerase
MKNIVILGSTGSIGASALDVIEGLGADYRVIGLAAGRNWRTLVEQAGKCRPRWIALAEPEACESARQAGCDREVREEPTGISEMAAELDADIVLSAIAGAAALM